MSGLSNNEKQQHAEAIARELGGTFENRDEHSPGNGKVTMPDGLVFWLSVGGWSGHDKVHAGTHYPMHETGANRMNGNTRYKTGTSQRDFDRTLRHDSPVFNGINLSIEKTPQQAAKDILRRFLPTYAPLYAQAVEYCRKQSEYLDAWEANNTAANEAARGTSGLSVDYVSRDYVQFKVSVSPANVEKLAEFLRGLTAG